MPKDDIITVIDTLDRGKQALQYASPQNRLAYKQAYSALKTALEHAQAAYEDFQSSFQEFSEPQNSLEASHDALMASHTPEESNVQDAADLFQRYVSMISEIVVILEFCEKTHPWVAEADTTVNTVSLEQRLEESEKELAAKMRNLKESKEEFQAFLKKSPEEQGYKTGFRAAYRKLERRSDAAAEALADAREAFRAISTSSEFYRNFSEWEDIGAASTLPLEPYPEEVAALDRVSVILFRHEQTVLQYEKDLKR